MARSVIILGLVLFSVLAGTLSSPEFSDVLSLLNDQHKEREADGRGFDEMSVESRVIVIPKTTVPEDGGTYCHAEELSPNERYVVGFEPVVADSDVKHIAMYGCLQAPASQDDEWTCSGEETVCAGPSVLMFDWKQGGCDEYLARGELITIGGRFIKHVVLIVSYEHGGYESSSGLELKLMSTDYKDTADLSNSVEYFSSVFNYVSKCPVEKVSSEEESISSQDEEPIEEEEDGESDEAEESEEAEGDEEREGDVSEETEPETETGVEEDAESSMTFYESLRQYGSSYSASNREVDYMEPLIEYNSAENEAPVDANDYIYSDGSSVEALINYLAEYWDDAFSDAPTLLSSGWWPREDIPIGQIAGLDIDARGNLVLFRRGERSWKPDDFDSNNVYIHDTPIQEQTLLVVDPMSGGILEAWGRDRFYLPHGLTIDHDNNIWLTDVAMHQVFKFSGNNDEPEMTFGEAFKPGSDVDHLCKPTDVAVCPETGNIFIADGYCNSRVLMFSSNGTFLKEISAHTEDDADEFRIPHSLAMVESLHAVCVADRENARIQCFDAKDGSYIGTYTAPEFGREVFAIAHNPVDDVLYAVNGPRLHRSDQPTSGFTIDLQNRGSGIIETWTPESEHFGVLHDIAVSPDGKSVYVADIETNRVWRFQKGSDVLNNMII